MSPLIYLRRGMTSGGRQPTEMVGGLTSPARRNAGARLVLGRWAALAAWFVLAGLVLPPMPARGDNKPVSWWEAETTLGKGGTLVLTAKPWWERARALKVGEHFSVVSQHPGGGKMLIRCERLKRGGKQLDAIVWVLDDDGDLRPDETHGDKDSDCYVVDYDADGRVDRMLDYQDNDADGRADEMDLRYFVDGELRRSWFWLDLDHDGRMWYVANYEYGGNNFQSDHYGDNVLFMNKFDPERKQWVPFSECPFAFYDSDGDGESEAVVRVSAVPLRFSRQTDPDYANSYARIDGPFAEIMRHMGVVNIRYSIDVDGLSSAKRPLHYDLGFNLVGGIPYQFKGMAHHNPLRRPPKTTICVPHGDLRQVAESYPAQQTGFSWHEHGDDAVALGAKPLADEDRRWEGVFWTWSRRIMQNTGGPTQQWNMRREFRGTPSKRRELYYCNVDRRIHLKGAGEGWIKVGHIGNSEPWGEIRFFDTDNDGYFDRWETYRAGVAAPVRVSTVRNPGVRDLPDDWRAIQQFYTKQVLPEALKANRKLMTAMRPFHEFTVPDHLAKAEKGANSDGERRYVLDVIRETQYLALRDKLAKRSGELFEAAGKLVMRRFRSDPQGRNSYFAASTRAWGFARTISKLDAAYGTGHYEEAIELLHKLAKLDSKQSST